MVNNPLLTPTERPTFSVVFDRDVANVAVATGQAHEPRSPAVAKRAGSADRISVAILDNLEDVHSRQTETAVDCISARTLDMCRGLACDTPHCLPVPDAASNCSEQSDFYERVDERPDYPSPMQAPAYALVTPALSSWHSLS
jgi:hypothetical protein